VTPRFPSPQPSPKGEGAGSSARRGPPAFQVCEFLCGGIRNPEAAFIRGLAQNEKPRMEPLPSAATAPVRFAEGYGLKAATAAWLKAS